MNVNINFQVFLLAFLIKKVSLKILENYRYQTSSIAVVGSTHSLNCFASSFSNAYPKWYHDENLIIDNKQGYWFENNKKSLLFNVTFNKGGKYNCNFNTHPFINRTFFVTIEEPPKWKYKPPVDVNASEGDKIIISCNATGKPKPQIVFYKNGIKINDLVGKYIVKDNQLILLNISHGMYGAGDNSIYQCKAENKHGYLWSNFYVNIIEFKPKLIKKSNDVEVIEGSDVIMFCEFSSIPTANIAWEGFKNVAYEVVRTGNKNKSKIRLKYVDRSSEGNYSCTGKNKFGSDEGNINVIVRNKTRFTVENDTSIVHLASRNLNLSCKVTHDEKLPVFYEWFIDNKHISKGKIDYEMIENNTLILKHTKINSFNSVKCKVSTKLNYVEKNFQVIIIDVPNPVKLASVIECNPNERYAKIHFEYVEKAYLYSPIMEFWIQYLIDSYNDSTSWITHPNPVTAENHEYIENNMRIVLYTVQIDLKPYCHYQFRIFARNSIGDSVPTLANEICTTSPDYPYNHPTDVRIESYEFDSIIVYWNTIQREEWNGPNFGYEIHYKSSSNGKWNVKKVDNPFKNSEYISFKEDKPFQLIDVKVLSVNDIGIGIEIPNIVQGRVGLLLTDNLSIHSERTTRTVDNMLSKKKLNDYQYFVVIIFFVIIFLQIILFIICLFRKISMKEEEILCVEEALMSNY
uniref:Neuroglian (inferred by orthology to a D. melanogaster protein) n=1 Tax=Strongyloides venezuelensis TaxID=75913 RepID=A0A0K0G523_STRVS